MDDQVVAFHEDSAPIAMPTITRRATFTSAGLAMLGSSLAAETKVTSTNDHRLNVRDFEGADK